MLWPKLAELGPVVRGPCRVTLHFRCTQSGGLDKRRKPLLEVQYLYALALVTLGLSLLLLCCTPQASPILRPGKSSERLPALRWQASPQENELPTPRHSLGSQKKQS